MVMASAEHGNGALAAALAGAAPLPCLRGNNSIDEPEIEAAYRRSRGPSIEVSKGAFKTEHCLKENIRLAAETYGLENLGFLTLTFAKAIYSARHAQKRMNSLLTNVIRPRYGNRYIGVLERHESSAIHFHFIIVVGVDIRIGFDWSLADAAYAAQRVRDFSKAGALWAAAADKAVNGTFLRKEWAFWRGLKRRYRWLGRCQLLPIKSTAEAIAKYTGGYIGKHMQNRRAEDKGVRLVRYGKGMRWVNSRIAFVSPKARLYRSKLAALVAEPRFQAAGVKEYADLKRVFGKRWGYFLLPAILEMELDYYPTRADAEADGHYFPRDCPADLVDIRITQEFSDAEMEREHHRERREKIRRQLFTRGARSQSQAERGAAP